MLTRIVIGLLKSCARLIYSCFKLLPVKNKVVLITRRSNATSIDFRLIADYIYTNHPETQVVILNHKMDTKLSHAGDIFKEMYHLATSKACIIDSYVISVSILNHKQSLVVVQIWHALGAIKEFGHAILDKKEGSSKLIARSMHMHRNYSYVIAGSEATKPAFSRAFNIPEDKIIPVGEPRVDYLLDTEIRQKNRDKILQTYPQLSGKQIIIYAPTFRKKNKINTTELFKSIDPTDQILIVTQHSHDKTKLQVRSGVLINKRFNILELLSIADAVITDYSATVFEASILDIPLYFYPYDIDKYQDNRGLTVDYYKEMPGFISTNANKLINAIKDKKYNTQKIRKFSDKYVQIQDGTSTERIVKLLSL